jgi:hypothetical protein
MKEQNRMMNGKKRSHIITEILEELHPLTCPEEEAKDTVKKSIEMLIEVAAVSKRISDRTIIRASAKKLGAALDAVFAAWHEMPAIVFWKTFVDEGGLSGKSDEEFYRGATENAGALLDQLTRMRDACQHAEEKVGVHPNVDHEKSSCAAVAMLLMRRLSAHKPTGTAEGRFRSISSLLYEALTGQQEVDLKRACQDCLPLDPRRVKQRLKRASAKSSRG